MCATRGIRAHVAVKQSGGLFYGAGSVKKKRLSAFLAYPGAKHGRVQAVALHTGFCHNIFMPKRTVPKRRSLSSYKKYTLAELLARCDPNRSKNPVEEAWDNAVPVGNEFGSPDADWPWWDGVIQPRPSRT